MRWSTSTSLTCSVVAGALAWSCALTVLATGFWPYEIDVALLHWEPTPQRPRPIGVFIVSFEFAAEEIRCASHRLRGRNLGPALH